MARTRPPIKSAAFTAACLLVALHFAFEGIQGEYGLFARLEAEHEIVHLESELDVLSDEIARMENLNRRLSDTYLDLDLLDERARSILGFARPDEIVLRQD